MTRSFMDRLFVASSHEGDRLWSHRPSGRQLLASGLLATPLLVLLDGALLPRPADGPGRWIAEILLGTAVFAGAIVAVELIRHAVRRE